MTDHRARELLAAVLESAPQADYTGLYIPEDAAIRAISKALALSTRPTVDVEGAKELLDFIPDEIEFYRLIRGAKSRRFGDIASHIDAHFEPARAALASLGDRGATK